MSQPLSPTARPYGQILHVKSQGPRSENIFTILVLKCNSPRKPLLSSPLEWPACYSFPHPPTSRSWSFFLPLQAVSHPSPRTALCPGKGKWKKFQFSSWCDWKTLPPLELERGPVSRWAQGSWSWWDSKMAGTPSLPGMSTWREATLCLRTVPGERSQLLSSLTHCIWGYLCHCYSAFPLANPASHVGELFVHVPISFLTL